MGKRLARGNPEYITTGAVAGHCGVSKVTVLRWIDKGYLAAFRLPSGHYRIRNDDFNEFLARHKMPGFKFAVREKKGTSNHFNPANGSNAMSPVSA